MNEEKLTLKEKLSLGGEITNWREEVSNDENCHTIIGQGKDENFKFIIKRIDTLGVHYSITIKYKGQNIGKIDDSDCYREVGRITQIYDRVRADILKEGIKYARDLLNQRQEIK